MKYMLILLFSLFCLQGCDKVITAPTPTHVVDENLDVSGC